MTNFIESNQVVGVNGVAFVYPNYVTGVVNGIQKQLNCNNLEIINSFWKVPFVVGTQVQKYTYLVAVNTSTPPTADSLKVLIVKDTTDNADYEIAIALTDNIATTSPPSQLAYLCNGTGGTLPVMPTVTIPFPIIQFSPTSTDGTNNVFTFAFPANPNSLLYSIPAPWFNGLAGAPAYVPAGITTPGQFVTWANSNWSAYGTWSNPSGTIVTLTSLVSNVTKCGMQIALTPANFCFNLTAFSTPALVNGVKFGSGTTIALDAFMLTNDPNVLIAALQKRMSAESTTFSTTVAHKLGIATVYAQPVLYNGTSVVATAASGSC